MKELGLGQSGKASEASLVLEILNLSGGRRVLGAVGPLTSGSGVNGGSEIGSSSRGRPRTLA